MTANEKIVAIHDELLDEPGISESAMLRIIETIRPFVSDELRPAQTSGDVLDALRLVWQETDPRKAGRRAWLVGAKLKLWPGAEVAARLRVNRSTVCRAIKRIEGNTKQRRSLAIPRYE